MGRGESCFGMLLRIVSALDPSDGGRDEIAAFIRTLAGTEPARHWDPHATPAGTEEQRERFEAFQAYRKASKGAVKRERLFARLPDGTYAEPSTQRHWWTWQNALAGAAAPQPARRLTDEQIDSAIHALNGIARDVDTFDYGLPLGDDDVLAKMRAAVRLYLEDDAP